MNLTNQINKTLLLSVTFLLTLFSCDKFLPTDRDSLEKEAHFTQLEYYPILGRYNWIKDNFATTNSSLPIKFKLTNIRRFDGEPAIELTQSYPVKVWKKEYTGTETSLEEIESKRATEHHPLLEIGESNGSIIFWPSGKSSFIKNQPDSGYIFDVEASNSGGRKFFKDLKLKPLKERPYEPNNINAITGLSMDPYVRPSSILGVVGDRTGANVNQVNVAIVKDESNARGGNTLTFRFIDSLGNAINPEKFNNTKWENLVHGFNMEKTSEHVRYKVAYPMPLIERPTLYTNVNGNRSRVIFSYNRLGKGQIVNTAFITFDFAIYEQGDWDIIFHFPNESPKFENE